jgi:hypothetical protein
VRLRRSTLRWREELVVDLPASPAGVRAWCPDELHNALLVASAVDPECLAVQKEHLVSLRQLARLSSGHDQAITQKAIDEQLAVMSMKKRFAGSPANRYWLNLDPDMRL